MLQLPTEIILRIGQFLDNSDILNLCLVCHAASQLFHDALFEQAQSSRQPALWRAVAHGRVDIASAIMKYRPDVNVNATYRGLTALCVAVERCDKAAIDFLWQQPTIDPNNSVFPYLNLLSLAARNGDLGVVERLLRFPTIDVNGQDSQGMTPAMHALVSGEFYILQLLLQDDRTNANITSNRGQTLLHMAARRADTVSIQLLVRHPRVDVNCLNTEHETPLLLAVKQTWHNKSGHAARSLLDSANVDVNTRDESGQTPLWYAVKSHDDDTVCAILQRSDVDFRGNQHLLSPLTLAIHTGRENVVRHILCHPNFSTPTTTGVMVSPLWDACRLGNTNLVRELLRWKVIDVNQPGPTGTSPLQVAIAGQHVSIVRLLLDQGDRLAVNDRGPQEWSALTFAAAAGQAEIVQLLLDHPRIDVSHTDDLGRGPLWWAVHGRHSKTVQLLLRRDHVGRGYRLKGLLRGRW